MEKNRSFLNEHPVRKTKKQKASFIQHLCSMASSLGYVSEIEQSKSGSRNVVVGDFVEASVVYTAHYDTPSHSVIPTFVTPKIPIISKLSQILVALFVLVPSFAVFFILSSVLQNAGVVPATAVIIAIAVSLAVFILLMVLGVGGPAEKENANSNTSGVLTLLEIMENMPEELRSRVVFVFLDNQENGYIGASEFAKRHKKSLEKKLAVNFDSVGAGQNIVASLSGKAIESASAIASLIEAEGDITAEVISGGKHIPSDHIKFKNSIGISAFKKKNELLYLNSNVKDSECRDENISYLTGVSVKLAENIVSLLSDTAINSAPCSEDNSENS